MRLTRHERQERKRRSAEALALYAKQHDSAEVKRHVAALNYPSGRWSHGGANRSANVKREIGLRVTHVTRCVTCGGVNSEVLGVTSLFPACKCLIEP